MAAAYAALASLMHTLHEIEHHHSPPISLDKQQAQSLTQNITFLQGFLESYNPPVSDDETADPLEMRIADAAYAAEDVIESHIADAIQLRNLFSLTRLFINFYKNLQRVIEEMDSIKKTAMSIETAEKAVVVLASSVSSYSGGPSSTTVVVGVKDASLKIMEKLTEDRPDCQVIPIVGMGGIGKTTLARNIYEQKLTKDRFDICAWATISQQYNTREILCEVYSHVNKKDEKKLNEISEAELGQELHKCLFGRRFLIVMDDMWSIDAWDNIQHFFPNNQNGSRILVTTRLLELSSRLNNDYSHQVGFLDEASSWDLFSKIVFGENNSCPCGLKEIGRKIVEGCRGLPLSIVVVGGLLKKIDATEKCWESIGSNLTSVVNLENDNHCLRLLRLSYNHLPVHLKPCFLYMGVFKEDTEIRVSTLVKLWISEGFLKPVNGESLETSAMRFFKDLVYRNLILISKLGTTANIKSCKIHDLLRDLCLKEGQKDGFYHIIGQRSPRCINRQRRIVIPRNASSEWEVLGDLRSMPHARSLIFENEIRKVPECSNHRLLRTIHVYTDILSGCVSFMDSFALQCVNLRHLTIKGLHGNMSSFLSSANLLWNLHTLIVSNWISSTHTIFEFWKMLQLRYIEFVENNLCLPDPPSVEDAIIMKNLNVLKGVRDFKCCGEMVTRIPNIKKLRVQYMGNNVDEYCDISNFKLLCKLESLSVDCRWDCSSYLPNFTFPHSLKRLSLEFDANFYWEESNMLEKIGSLPFLEKLILRSGSFGRTGRWEIVEGRFPCLKYLSIDSCCGLEHWTAAEEGSSIFPCLEQILLFYLEELKSIPCEIGDIPTLQEIEISFCNEAAIQSAKEMVDEQVELQGNQLSFRVVVVQEEMNQELHQSLSGPNFEVFTYPLAHNKSSSHEHR